MKFSLVAWLFLTVAAATLSITNAQEEADCSTINEIACTTDGFTTLCDLLELSGLDAVLDGNSNTTFTVFAPLDSAFEELPEMLVEEIVNSTGQ